MVYFESADADLHVVVPDLNESGVKRGDDPGLGRMKGYSLNPCALDLQFQFHLIDYSMTPGS
jgi:hypothetical protein